MIAKIKIPAPSEYLDIKMPEAEQKLNEILEMVKTSLMSGKLKIYLSEEQYNLLTEDEVIITLFNRELSNNHWTYNLHCNCDFNISTLKTYHLMLKPRSMTWDYYLKRFA